MMEKYKLIKKGRRLGVFKCKYNSNNELEFISEEPATLLSETRSDLIMDVRRIEQALKEPFIDIESIEDYFILQKTLPKKIKIKGYTEPFTRQGTELEFVYYSNTLQLTINRKEIKAEDIEEILE